IGPYETAGPNYGKPCPDLQSPTCTYQLCKKNPNIGWACQPGGKCCPQSFTQGLFPTEDECYACFDKGICPGSGNPNNTSVCCPASKNGYSCYSSSPPPTSPGSGRNLLIEGAIGVGILIVLL